MHIFPRLIPLALLCTALGTSVYGEGIPQQAVV